MTSNKRFLMGIAAAFLLVAKSAVAECFAGKWTSRDPDFLLELKQHGQQLSGSHLIVAQRGAKIDASEDENDQTISGTIVGDVASVKFLSSFGGTGQARILCKNKKMEWKLVEAKGIHWFPQAANLEPVSPPAKSVSRSFESTKGSHATSLSPEFAHPIKFAKGERSATISGLAVKGEMQKYVLHAKAGQKMTVRVDAIEDNAVFQIRTPEENQSLSGAGEEDNTKSWEGQLPLSGRYMIVVGSTRANTTYKLKVAIDANSEK